jgi:hypothetical protein
MRDYQPLSDSISTLTENDSAIRLSEEEVFAYLNRVKPENPVALIAFPIGSCRSLQLS